MEKSGKCIPKENYKIGKVVKNNHFRALEIDKKWIKKLNVSILKILDLRVRILGVYGFLVQSCPILLPTHSSVGENNDITNLILDLKPSSMLPKRVDLIWDGRGRTGIIVS